MPPKNDLTYAHHFLMLVQPPLVMLLIPLWSGIWLMFIFKFPLILMLVIDCDRYNSLTRMVVIGCKSQDSLMLQILCWFQR